MTSAVASALDPCCAVALHANQKTIQALEMLSNAISIDPNGVIGARIMRSSIIRSANGEWSRVTDGDEDGPRVDRIASPPLPETSLHAVATAQRTDVTPLRRSSSFGSMRRTRVENLSTFASRQMRAHAAPTKRWP